jgi:hypothetical protein
MVVPEGCRCVANKRTKKFSLLCKVPKSKKHRSGMKFTKDVTGACSSR